MYRFGMKVLLCWIGIIGILAAIPQSEAAKNAWTPLNEPFSVDVFVSALAIDPINPDIIYAGTGDGMLKSIDSGNSWQHINKGITTGVNALAINPKEPNIIYAGGGGVFKSTDSGDNWTQILKDRITVLAINPLDPNIIFASANAISNGVYRSSDELSGYNVVWDSSLWISHFR